VFDEWIEGFISSYEFIDLSTTIAYGWSSSKGRSRHKTREFLNDPLSFADSQ